VKFIFLIILFSSCSQWSSDSYYQGIRDGAYSGCIFVLDKKIESDFNDEDMSYCRDVYKEWDDFINENRKKDII